MAAAGRPAGRHVPGQRARTQDAAPGAHVRPGALLGHVEARSGQQPVTPPFPAHVIEWLVEDGDPVAAGQPLVRLQPEAA